MNTTFVNPTPVSGSQSVNENGFVSPKPQTPVEQLEQRAANWPALEPVEPPPIGSPSPDQVLRIDTPRHDWPVYLVKVPADWEPQSWRSAPPNTTSYKKATTAAKVAAMLNRERMECSEDGYVSHWYIRIRMGSRYGNISVTLPRPWKPKDEFDLPPAFIRIDGPRDQCRQIVGDLNKLFDQCDPGEPRKRAYIARSIHPDDLKTFPPKEEPAEAQLVEPEEDETELFEIQLGHHFGTNPTISEDVMLHVQNACTTDDARRKADLFLMESAIDMNQRVALNGYSEADDDGNEYKVVLSDGTLLRLRMSRCEALNLVSVWNQSRKHSEPEAKAVKR